MGRSFESLGVGGLALMCFACGEGPQAEGTHEASSPPDPAVLSESDEVLSIGNRGEQVRALHHYLAQFGFLPNPTLQREFPGWRSPVAVPPARQDVFDESTAQAVSALQRFHRLEETGVVDATTRELLTQERCGNPELDPVDETSKWDLTTGSLYKAINITWKVISPASCGLTQLEADAAATAAFASWESPTYFTFTKVPGDARVEIRCSSTDASGNPWPSNLTAQARYPENGSDVWLNATAAWSVTSSGTPGKYDFQSIVAHELGHALGIAHSSVSSRAVMYPHLGAGVIRRFLHHDDRAAGIALGVTWEGFSGGIHDIDVDGNGNARIIHAIGEPPIRGGYTVWRKSDGAWTSLSGQGGVRVASHANELWIVTDEEEVWEYVSGIWHNRHACATDIAVGGDGSVWIVSCETQLAPNNGAPKGFKVRKWDGASFVAVTGGQGAVRISVGPKTAGGANVPWIIDNAGNIFRRSSGDPASGTYAQLPGKASEIAVSPGGAAYITDPRVSDALGHVIYSWNEQPAFGTGTPPPLEQFRWRRIDGRAVNIAVDGQAFPFIVDAHNRASQPFL
jgi:peptidoglycan hydrolase-like protein with peptidoglycan-binding domain